MIWNHKCKSPPSNARLPLHAKHPTAAADAGLSLAVINSARICTARKPRFFPAPPPFPFLSTSTQEMTIHAYSIISVFDDKNAFFISVVGEIAHEQPGGLWSQSCFFFKNLSIISRLQSLKNKMEMKISNRTYNSLACYPETGMNKMLTWCWSYRNSTMSL